MVLAWWWRQRVVSCSRIVQQLLYLIPELRPLKTCSSWLALSISCHDTSCGKRMKTEAIQGHSCCKGTI